MNNNTAHVYRSDLNEAAKQIRADLKLAGIPARAVSVRVERFSMGCAIRVYVKAIEGVSYAAVREAAEAQEKIDRDMHGEILGGSNRYVSISVDSDVFAPVVAALEAVPANERRAFGRRLSPVTGGRYGDEIDVEGVSRSALGLAGAVEAAFVAGPLSLADQICNAAECM